MSERKWIYYSRRFESQSNNYVWRIWNVDEAKEEGILLQEDARNNTFFVFDIDNKVMKQFDTLCNNFYAHLSEVNSNYYFKKIEYHQAYDE